MVTNGLQATFRGAMPDNRVPASAFHRSMTSRRTRTPRSLLAAATAAVASAVLPAGIAVAASEALEEIVVTATRRPAASLATPLSLGVVDDEAIRLLGATHHSEVLNRVPGVMIQRGSGQESLTAIRSPVLTGAGSCGAFLFLENGVPIRPVGFCNVNEMFEVNTEQAGSIEVLRGPGTALYGSSAMHGTVNVLQPAPDGRPLRGVGLETGPSDYGRVKLAGRLDTGATAYGVAGHYTHDGGWRDDSGYDEAKFNATVQGRWRDTPARVDFAATYLDQDTAGFITGKGAYRDEQASRGNPNPEAYREAHALRLTGLVERPDVAGARLEVRPYLRSSRMEFLQHFLLGQPLERNGQESAGLMSSLVWDGREDRLVVAGLDLELADSFLLQEQDGPTTGGTPPANAIRPAGKHYDYSVRSHVAALYVHAEQRLGERVTASGGLRAEAVGYDYDNQMLAGNTDENGVPCAPAGCLYSRPADRTDAFLNVAPKLALSFDLRDGVVAYTAASVGFRPPEITELYRLQRNQLAADLDSERLDAVEAGVKAALPTLELALAAFAMRKHNVILRESNGFNVADGETSHRGVEYELRWRPVDTVELGAAGTFARHRYEFSRAVEGGEVIADGNDVDTAPRQLHRAAARWDPTSRLAFEAEWQVVGEYWLDAANAHRYPGHALLNLRGRWTFAPQWGVTLRLNNALDRDYADRADFAFGSYRYFPGRGRALFAEVTWARP
jgi:outer membrane receptor protein involved in Fe transport